MYKVYVGFDSTNYGQQLAFDVCKKSIECDLTCIYKRMVPRATQFHCCIRGAQMVAR